MLNKEAVLENSESCPKCGATENSINWGRKNHFDDMMFRDAVCNKCGCCFTQENKVVYQLTTWYPGQKLNT